MREENRVEDTVSWIAGLMRTDYPALSFIPDTTIRDRYIAKERYILQKDERGRRVGYLLHGAIKWGQLVVISQAMIDFDARLRGYGEKAVMELIRRAEIGGASSIHLRCAADLEAVKFWQSMNFEIVRTEPGGIARNRMIFVFVYWMNLPLFSPLIVPQEAAGKV